MPPTKNNPYSKNLKHFLSCERCGFDNLPCPKAVKSEDLKSDKSTQISEVIVNKIVVPSVLKKVIFSHKYRV